VIGNRVDVGGYTHRVDNQSNGIPENINAIAVLSGTVIDTQESIRMTNEILGFKPDFP